MTPLPFRLAHSREDDGNPGPAGLPFPGSGAGARRGPVRTPTCSTTTSAGPLAGPKAETPLPRRRGSGDDLVFTWDSQGGKLYNLRSETDLSAAEPIDWPIFDGNADIEATPPENTLTIPRPADADALLRDRGIRRPAGSRSSPTTSRAVRVTGPPGRTARAGTAWELGAPTSRSRRRQQPGSIASAPISMPTTPSTPTSGCARRAIDLTTAGGATLNFEFRDIEEGFDFGRSRARCRRRLGARRDRRPHRRSRADWEKVASPSPPKPSARSSRSSSASTPMTSRTSPGGTSTTSR